MSREKPVTFRQTDSEHLKSAKPIRSGSFQNLFSMLNCTLKKIKGEIIILTLCLVFTHRKSAAASAFVFLYPDLSDKKV